MTTSMHTVAGVIGEVEGLVSRLLDMVERDLRTFAEDKSSINLDDDDAYDCLAEVSGFRALNDACDKLGEWASWPDSIVTKIEREESREAGLGVIA